MEMIREKPGSAAAIVCLRNGGGLRSGIGLRNGGGEIALHR